VPSTNTAGVTTTNGSKNFAANDPISILLTPPPETEPFLIIEFRLLQTGTDGRAEEYLRSNNACGDPKKSRSRRNPCWTGRPHLEGLGTASQIDPAYLTYVLWAIPASQGKPQNLGELMVKGGDSTVTTFTNLTTFAM
jgi:hypothetical protein